LFWWRELFHRWTGKISFGKDLKGFGKWVSGSLGVKSFQAGGISLTNILAHAGLFRM
jgi:hypothetical protein